MFFLIEYLYIKRFSFILSFAFISACGGGGEGGVSVTASSSNTVSTINQPIIFQPSSLVAQLYQGDVNSISGDVIVNQKFDQSVNLRIDDLKGITSGAPSVSVKNGAAHYFLPVSSKLLPGSYDGILEVSLCYDSSATCQQPYAGSPWHVPYHIDIRPLPNLIALSAIAGAGDWSTYKGNNAHTGFVPINLNPEKFSLRFRWAADKLINGSISSLTTKGGITSFHVDDNGRQITAAYAIDESLGVLRWKTKGITFGAVSDGDNIYYIPGNVSTTPIVFSANRATGVQSDALVFKYSYSTFGIVDGGVFYSSDSQYPVVDKDYWYSFKSPNLSKISKTSRTTVSQSVVAGIDSVVNPNTLLMTKCSESAFLFSSRKFFSTDPTGYVSNYDPSTMKLNWTYTGNLGVDLVCNGSVFYVFNNSRLEERRLIDGELNWSWTSNENTLLNTKLLLTNTHLLLLKSGKISAFSLIDRKVVWSHYFPENGDLAVSRDGVLYATGTTYGILYAFNLQ